jgi:hypothetical protein
MKKKYVAKITKDIGFLIEGRCVVEASSLKKARKYISETLPDYTIVLIKEYIENISDDYLK